MGRIWKDVAVVSLEVQSWHLAGENEEKHDKPE
jgi:hypothetical protein